MFQVVSLMTSTGFVTADFEKWPALALIVFLHLMFLGGMAGSTTGGIKSLRVLIGLRSLANVFERLRHRAAVAHPVRYGGKPVSDQVLAGIWVFLFAYFMMVAVVALIVAAAGYDLTTAVSAGLSSVGNIGPGLGEIGPFDNFAHFPTSIKLVLCAAMTAGRLELFTILILFHRDFWRH